jgi:uncharacterized coiled-coil DUF342 family protein
MPTKAQIQEQRDELFAQLGQLQKEHEQVRQSLDQVRLVLHVTERDLQRTIDFVSDRYDEAGSELAERFERGMKLALERLRASDDLLEQQHPIEWTDSLWREGTGE